ncbi:hypothetical protein Q5752_001874 [Cryptotrichosporon argae]
MSAEDTKVEAQAPAAPAAEAQDEGYRVYIGNLPYSATEEQVREHVAKVGGEIISVILPTRFKSARPAGHAFVLYKNEEDAKKAVDQLNDTDFGDRKVSLELARSKAENAARKAEIIAKRDAERQAAKESTGETTAVESDAKPKKRSGKKSSARRRRPEEGDETAVEVEEKKAEAEGEAPAAAKKTKARKPLEARIDEPAADGEAKEPKAAKKSKAPKERKPRLELTGEISKGTIFVANLPFTVDDDGLAQLFTDLSISVKSAKIIRGLRRLPNRKPFRGSKGFGFVELENDAQQQEAVDKINGSAIGDRKVTAKVAQQMKPIEVEQATEGREAEAASVAA